MTIAVKRNFADAHRQRRSKRKRNGIEAAHDNAQEQLWNFGWNYLHVPQENREKQTIGDHYFVVFLTFCCNNHGSTPKMAKTVFIDRWKPVRFGGWYYIVGDAYQFDGKNLTECPQPDNKKSETGRFESHLLDPLQIPVQYQNAITVFPTRCQSQNVRLLRPHSDYKTMVDELVKTRVAGAKDAKEAEQFKEASAVLDSLSKLDVSPKALATTPWTVFSVTAMGMLFAPGSPLFANAPPCASGTRLLP